MSIHTEHNLQTETVGRLQDLIQINIDSVKGFNECADLVKDNRLADLFRSLAAERSDLANELQQHVAHAGERPQTEGSFLAQIHQTWLGIRGHLSGNDPLSILKEAERGEDAIKEAYEDVIKETVGQPVNDLLLSHYRIVKSGHDEVRDLRDAYKASR